MAGELATPRSAQVTLAKTDRGGPITLTRPHADLIILSEDTFRRIATEFDPLMRKAASRILGLPPDIAFMLGEIRRYATDDPPSTLLRLADAYERWGNSWFGNARFTYALMDNTEQALLGSTVQAAAADTHGNQKLYAFLADLLTTDPSAENGLGTRIQDKIFKRLAKKRYPGVSIDTVTHYRNRLWAIDVNRKATEGDDNQEQTEEDPASSDVREQKPIEEDLAALSYVRELLVSMTQFAFYRHVAAANGTEAGAVRDRRYIHAQAFQSIHKGHVIELRFRGKRYTMFLSERISQIETRLVQIESELARADLETTAALTLEKGSLGFELSKLLANRKKLEEAAVIEVGRAAETDELDEEIKGRADQRIETAADLDRAGGDSGRLLATLFATRDNLISAAMAQFARAGNADLGALFTEATKRLNQLADFDATGQNGSAAVGQFVEVAAGEDDAGGEDDEFVDDDAFGDADNSDPDAPQGRNATASTTDWETLS